MPSSKLIPELASILEFHSPAEVTAAFEAAEAFKKKKLDLAVKQQCERTSNSRYARRRFAGVAA